MSYWIEGISPSISVEVRKDGETLRAFQAGTYTMPVGTYKSIFTNLDLSGLSSGDYVIRVKTNLDGVEKQKDFNIIVNVPETKQLAPEAGPTLGLTTVIVFTLIVVVLIAFLILLLLFRSDEEEEKKGKK